MWFYATRDSTRTMIAIIAMFLCLNNGLTFSLQSLASGFKYDNRTELRASLFVCSVLSSMPLDTQFRNKVAVIFATACTAVCRKRAAMNQICAVTVGAVSDV